MEEALRNLQEYLRIDTSNPPGREEEAAKFLQHLLSKEGISCEVYIPEPGRANLLAKLGEGKGALLFLHHMDVVPAERDMWTEDPFGGCIKDGFIWGRGTLDTKAFGMAQVWALVLTKRRSQRLKRPVWLLATADEETGGKAGAKWCLENIPDLREVAFVLNEGGSIVLRDDGTPHHYEISVAQKVVAQFSLKATGRSGHGSIPHGDNAAEKLVRTTFKLLAYQPPIRVIPLVRHYLEGIMGDENPEAKKALEVGGQKLEGFLKTLSLHPQIMAMLRDTFTLTVLKAGTKVNVIPSQAEALFDCRLLPDTDPLEFFKGLRSLLDEEGVSLEPLSPVEPSPPSPLTTPLYKAIERLAHRKDPGVPVVPMLITGATDSRFFRSAGIPCYDFVPFRLKREELSLVHNVDERLRLENFFFAIDFLYELILEVAT